MLHNLSARDTQPAVVQASAVARPRTNNDARNCSGQVEYCRANLLGGGRHPLGFEECSKAQGCRRARTNTALTHIMQPSRPALSLDFPPFRQCPAEWFDSPRSSPAAGGLQESNRAWTGGPLARVRRAAQLYWHCTPQHRGHETPGPPPLLHCRTAGGCGVKVANILAQHGRQVLVPHVVHLPHACGASKRVWSASGECTHPPRPANTVTTRCTHTDKMRQVHRTEFPAL